VGGGPVLIILSRYVLVRAKLEDVVLFVVAARDADDLVSAKSLREKDTEVAKAADANDADLLAGSAAVVLERAVKGD